MQRLARIALASEQGQPAEVLADIQRRALNGIVVVTQKAWPRHCSLTSATLMEESKLPGRIVHFVTDRTAKAYYDHPELKFGG